MEPGHMLHFDALRPDGGLGVSNRVKIFLQFNQELRKHRKNL